MAAVAAIWAHVPSPSGLRSILKPVSLSELYYLLINAGTLYLCLGYLLKERSIADYSVSGYLVEKYGITAREASLLPLVMRGFGNKQIAYELEIKLQTVKQHLSSIFRKTNTQSRFELMNLVVSQRPEPVAVEL